MSASITAGESRDNGLQAIWNRLRANPKIPLLVAASAAIAIVVALLLWVKSPDYRVLYSNLNDRDGGAIVTQLTQMNIPYRFAENGAALLIPAEKVHETRLRLAQQGLPKGGAVSFELLDQEKFGISQFSEQINYQRALEGELSRTIMSMRGITAARVHITMPRREMFTSAAGEPTAAVLVGLGGRDLSGDQVNAIRNLVASSVPNLKPDRVTVADENNRTLAAGSEGGEFTTASALEAKNTTEAQLQNRIKDIVEGVVGVGAARVQVTADIDRSRSTTQEQKFDPDGQVVRSTSTNGSQSSDTSGVPASDTSASDAPSSSRATSRGRIVAALWS